MFRQQKLCVVSEACTAQGLVSCNVAEITAGWSATALANLMNEAAILMVCFENRSFVLLRIKACTAQGLVHCKVANKTAGWSAAALANLTVCLANPACSVLHLRMCLSCEFHLCHKIVVVTAEWSAAALADLMNEAAILTVCLTISA